MNDKPAAAFVRIKNRLINIVAICSIVWHEGLEKLIISFGTGEKLDLKDPSEVQSFLGQIAPYEIAPPQPIPEPLGTAPPADNPDLESEDDPGDDNSDDGDDDPGTSDETDDEPSELELAGLPADVAALLHAGGIDTVEAVLTHPDLTQVEGIGANRKDKILKILKT